ncbi:MAG TPA: lipase secretion chaperone [Dongiaceae bacterium]|nr:lipase secretion chaperone [Dongiaceae bacterium]
MSARTSRNDGMKPALPASVVRDHGLQAMSRKGKIAIASAVLIAVMAVSAGDYWQTTVVDQTVARSNAQTSDATPVNSGAVATPSTPGVPNTSESQEISQALYGTSLADVDIPQTLRTDENGQLITDEGLRALMDFFLTLTGERDAAQIRALFTAAAADQCAATCVEQALAVYDRYQQYLGAMQAASAQLQSTDDLRARLNLVTGLRSETLGDEWAQGLFADTNAYDNLRVSQWEIRTNKALSSEEKVQALADLQTNLPPELAAREQETARLQAIRALNQQLTQSNADEATRFAARSEQLNPDEVERLHALDERRAQWDQRYQRYRSERAALDQSEMDAADKEQALMQLRQQHFSEQESQRAAAMDRINGLDL